MCAVAAIPVALQWIMAGATLAAGVASADAARQEGKMNAAVAENNQRIAVAKAEESNALATREMEQASWRTRALMGQQRAAFAAGNLDPTTGTPADILGETAMFGEVDQQNVRLNAARQAWGYQAEGLNYGNEANMARWRGNTQSTITILGALGQAGQQAAGAWGGGGGATKFSKSGPAWTASKTGGNIKGGY